MTTDGGLFGSSPRPDGPLPKLVVIGIAWAAFGVVALITAVLMKSVGIAVFGILCVLAGGGLYAGQRARERLEADERSWRSDPGGYLDDDPLDDVDDEPDDEPDDDPADDRRDEANRDAGAPSEPDREHATRVMSTHDHDDIVDAEYSEYEPSPSEQDDGTGYDDDETAYQLRREAERARGSARAREDRTDVIEADDDADEAPEHHTGGDSGDDAPDRTDRSDRPRRDATS